MEGLEISGKVLTLVFNALGSPSTPAPDVTSSFYLHITARNGNIGGEARYLYRKHLCDS